MSAARLVLDRLSGAAKRRVSERVSKPFSVPAT